MKTDTSQAILLFLLMGAPAAAAAEPAIAVQQSAKPQPRPAHARGVADAAAAFNSGHPGLYVHHYSNMPNGPDDPVLAQQRDMQIAVLQEMGIESHSSNSGCIPSPDLALYAQGYNSVAEGLLKAKFGAGYMDDVRQEVARRMKAYPPKT